VFISYVLLTNSVEYGFKVLP